MLMLLPIAAQADAVEIGGIYYNLITKGKVAEVTSNPNKYTGSIVIPASVTYNDVEYSVTSIGSSAFKSCSGLTSVTIPGSVTSIGIFAFSGCSGLTSVTIPNSVTSIGNFAFSECSGIEVMSVENGNTVYDSRNNCNAIVETSTNTLISGCKNTIIPNSVTSIGERAFYDCSGLTSVTIPNSVTSIGNFAFSECSGIEVMSVENGNTVYDSRNNCNAIVETSTNTLISGCKNTIIPNNVTSIGSSAFSGCSGLTSVTIPNSVTFIGSSAFYGCSGLTSVTIPNSVTSIGDGAFKSCSGLTSMTIGNSVTSIGSRAFSNCSGLTSVTIPNSVTSIADYAFYECRGLTSVTIGNSVTSIGSSAFRSCSGLTSVTIPNSVTSIGNYAFWNCSGLTSVTVENPEPAAIFASTFSNYANATLYVPVGAKAAYEAADYWKEFAQIVEKGVETTDISQLDNVIYIEDTEAVTGMEKTLSLKMKNAVAVQTVQFDLKLPEGVTVVESEDSELMTASKERISKFNYFNSARQTDGSIRLLAQATTTNIAAGDGEIARIVVRVAEDMAEGEYPVIVKEALMVERDNSSHSPEPNEVQSKLTVYDYTPGDANGDRAVNGIDFNMIGNAILGYSQTGFNSRAADISGDGAVNAIDFNMVGNIILTGSTASAPRRAGATDEPTDLSGLTDAVYAAPLTIAAGSEQTLSLKMKNSMTVQTIQFDLYLPEGLTVVPNQDNELITASKERINKYNYFSSARQTDGSIRLLAQSTSTNFAVGDGEIATVTVKADAGMAVGNYVIAVKNILLVSKDNEDRKADCVNTTLTVTEAAYTVLDETSTTVPEATSSPVDIKVKRTLKGGEWSTICLPFAMTEAQVKEAFGSDVQLKEFVDYEAEYDNDENVTNIKVNFEDADLAQYGFEANFPYLIKVSADMDEFTVNSTIEPDEEYCYTEWAEGKGSRKKVYGTFKGTLHAQTTVPENCLFLSGNKFWYSTGQTKMKAFRGYFDFVDVLSSLDAASARINLSFNGSETTGIRINDNNNVNDNYYDLQGRRVEKPTRGLYIKGNKKVFVK